MINKETCTDLIKQLKALLPNLEYSRQTHIDWRDCDQYYRDRNPNIGNSEFHQKQVDIYTNRINVINKTIAVLESDPANHEDKWCRCNHTPRSYTTRPICDTCRKEVEDTDPYTEGGG